jgi:hypothetical protein
LEYGAENKRLRNYTSHPNSNSNSNFTDFPAPSTQYLAPSIQATTETIRIKVTIKQFNNLTIPIAP